MKILQKILPIGLLIGFGLLIIIVGGVECLIWGNIQSLKPPHLGFDFSSTPVIPSVVVRRNQNIESLTHAQATMGKFNYGFAPLLLLDKTRLMTTSINGSEGVMLRYPRQPVEPTKLLSVDSFVLAYATQHQLLTSPPVANVWVIKVALAAALENSDERLNHFIVLVNFTDNSETIVDLTPLSPNFGAYYPDGRVFMTRPDLESQFARWRDGVLLNELQPLLVVEREGESYYILTKVQAWPNRYDFSLRVHLVQKGTHTEPLRLTRGSSADISISRSDFHKVQANLQANGPNALSQQRDLWHQRGDHSAAMTQVLEEHLFLLWHLVTKLKLE